MSPLAELLPPGLKLEVPEIQTYRGYQARPESPGIVLLTDLELSGRRQRLGRPLRLRLVLDEDRWFAENETLNLFGTGASPKEAVQDFRNHFVHFAGRYRALGWDEVSGDGARLKMLYETLLGADAA